MRILIGHNRYQQPGGEDAVVQTECKLLSEFGDEVEVYERNNSELAKGSLIKKIRFPFDIQWSKESYRQVKQVIQRFKPDIAHFHNIHFVLTPSVFAACRDAGVPVVQSLHNFRLLCANALFFRDNKVCEECLDKKSLRPGIAHRCYKDSRLLTAAVVRMLEKHWRKGTWLNQVDAYVMATEFGRQKYIAGGVPEEKIFVKPNFFYLDGIKQEEQKEWAVYVGRLSGEKGVMTMVKAWKGIKGLKLKILGDGPLKAELQAMIKGESIENVELCGFVSNTAYENYMTKAQCIIVPSECYENFPRVVAEAYAFGIPLIASRIGSFPELVVDRVTGKLFQAGSSEDLADKVAWLLNNHDEVAHMRKNVIEEYQKKYSAQENYRRLKEIYAHVIEGKNESKT